MTELLVAQCFAFIKKFYSSFNFKLQLFIIKGFCKWHKLSSESVAQELCTHRAYQPSQAIVQYIILCTELLNRLTCYSTVNIRLQ